MADEKISKVIESLTQTISNNASDDPKFYDNLAAEISEAGRRARRVTETSGRFEDPSSFKELQQQFSQEFRALQGEQHAQLNLMDRYRQKYGDQARRLWGWQ